MSAGRPGRRAAALTVAAVVLAIAAVVLLVAGVQVRETTGGLLVVPIRQLHLLGGFLLAGTAAGVAAVIVALAAVPALRTARRPRREPAPDRPAGDRAAGDRAAGDRAAGDRAAGDADEPARGPVAEPGPATVPPGSDHRS